MKIFLKSIVIIFMSTSLSAQQDLEYQKPSKEILELFDYEKPPMISLDSKNENIIFLYSNPYKSIGNLCQDEIRLAGLRINPKTNILREISYVNNLKIRKLIDLESIQIRNLPKNGRLYNFIWSPDETKIAFTNTTEEGVELWLLDMKEAEAKKISEPNLNAVLGNPITWFRDGNSILARMLPKDKMELINPKKSIPKGPIVSVSDGTLSQNRTYQDLLKNKDDEYNFEALATSELYKIDLSGKKTFFKEKAIYLSETFSPDGNYVIFKIIKKPFSYIVPYSKFPFATSICDKEGKLISNFDESPLLEDLPKGFMSVKKGKRNINWRDDKNSTIYWVEALDEGNPENEVDYRDEIFQIEAPFNLKPKSLIKSKNRYSNVIWGNDDFAILEDYWWNTRNTKTYIFNPSRNKKESMLFDRNYQDKYSDPGNFDLKKNSLGKYILNMDGEEAYLVGSGFTEKGQFPFVDKINLKTKRTERIFQSNYTDKKLNISSIIDARKGEYIIRLESKNEYPNYYILKTKKKFDPIPITNIENPFKKLENIYKEIIRYKRDDGIELTGTLYLPEDYDVEKKEKLPMILWAYPTEFKDKNSAGQNTKNINDFVFPSYHSPIFWTRKGYAVFDGASFPIIGEGNSEPNDTFITQLISNAKAAIDKLDSLGYIDRNRVAVGGHSYGAFMVANLLTHSNLFAAGIARSGAYNRTLTPFGFQSEERNYWEAPKVYINMSPFMYVDKMKTPLLLIHGEDDHNSGTFTMQSERYFNALKGFGAPVRLVILPKESHGYVAKESILHLLWEQDQWLEKYVKNKKK